MELTRSAVLFLKEIDAVKYPDADEERLLIQRGKHGDIDARNELIKRHIKYLLVCAKPYQDQGVEFMDLIQAGVQGMIYAFEKFKPEFGFRFLVYATHWIHRMMNELVYKQGNTVIRPYKFRSRRNAIWMLQNHFCINRGRLPTTDEIVRVLEMKESEVWSHLKGEIISLDTELDADTGSKREFYALLPSSKHTHLDVLAERDEYEWQKYELMRALRSLKVPRRDKKIFMRRHGLDGAAVTPMFAQIASEFGVSRGTVISVEKKVRELIRNSLTKRLKTVKNRRSTRWSRNVKKR